MAWEALHLSEGPGRNSRLLASDQPSSGHVAICLSSLCNCLSNQNNLIFKHTLTLVEEKSNHFFDPLELLRSVKAILSSVSVATGMERKHTRHTGCAEHRGHTGRTGYTGCTGRRGHTRYIGSQDMQVVLKRGRWES